MYLRKNAKFRDSSMVEQLTVNQLVPGSNPGRGALHFLFWENKSLVEDGPRLEEWLYATMQI